ncbi:MAG: hypothetical protein PHD21_07640 [Flavobacteriales bacterium]|nr:hypothetical protein [Flavobacteriales bacterium]
MEIPSVIEKVIYKSLEKGSFCYTPAIAQTHSGVLAVTFDNGKEGTMLISADMGDTWQERGHFPFYHAHTFAIGESIYIMGHDDNVKITKTTDYGRSFSPVTTLTRKEKWHASSGSIVFKNGQIHIAMERHTAPNTIKGWAVADLAPVLWSADVNADLLDAKSWRRSEEKSFKELTSIISGNGFGIPFYPVKENEAVDLSEDLQNSPLGFLEGNVVDICSKDHIWYDTDALYIFLRSHTSGVNMAQVVKMTEHGGVFHPSLPLSPSGMKMTYVPFLGGHLKFNIIYEPKSQLYWSVTNQSFDSMLTLDAIKKTGIFGLPNNERHRLILSFSKNAVDWCMAQVIKSSYDARFSSCYPSALISGDDMVIVARSADKDAPNAQRTNTITLYTVTDFRNKTY